MNTAATIVEPRIAELRVTESEIAAYLVDGRTVSVPLAWSWRLSEATTAQRNHWEMAPAFIGRRSMRTSALKACCMVCLYRGR